MLESKFIVIADEEAGPKSNKMGGIWNVTDAGATNLERLLSNGEPVRIICLLSLLQAPSTIPVVLNGTKTGS